jgi:hypothetical protein
MNYIIGCHTPQEGDGANLGSAEGNFAVAESAIHEGEFQKACDVYSILLKTVPFDAIDLHSYKLAKDLDMLQQLTLHISHFPDNRDAIVKRARLLLDLKASPDFEQTVTELINGDQSVGDACIIALRKLRIEAASQSSEFRDYLFGDVAYLWIAFSPPYYKPQTRLEVVSSLLRIVDPSYGPAIHAIANASWMDSDYRPILLNHVANLQELVRLKQMQVQ